MSRGCTARAGTLVRDTYARLTPWQKVQVARHPGRPHFLDYAKRIFDDFTPLAGDRSFGEDQAVVAGLARFRGRPVAFIGQEKGNDTQSRIKHNFGSAMPEGYRKAVRMFELADRFGLPVLSFCDTSGAYPGVSAEERGQAEAIARSIEAGLSRQGAVHRHHHRRRHVGRRHRHRRGQPRLYAGACDLFGDLAGRLRLHPVAQRRQGAGGRHRAQDHGPGSCCSLKVIDAIVPEPVGGAHRAPEEAIDAVADQIAAGLQEMEGMSGEELLRQRRGPSIWPWGATCKTALSAYRRSASISNTRVSVR